MAIEIKLRKSDRVAFVSDQDAHLAERIWSWHNTLGVVRYDAKRYDAKMQRTPHILITHVITQAPPKWRVVHLDGNRLNNQRGNLLLLSGLQYAQYVRKRPSKSGYVGVVISRNAYEVRIQHQYLGRFDNPEEAARVYDAEAIERFGASARLNFPRPFVVCHECHRAFFELTTATTCAECALSARD